MTLQGKVAIVTGSSRGIGEAISVRLGQAGASVIVNYLKSSDAAAEVVQRINQAGGQGHAVQGDVTNLDDIQGLVDQAVERFGRLDILVNNAGAESRSALLETDESTFDKSIAVNLKGAFFGTKIAAQRMIDQGEGGRIINISSVHEDWPMPGNNAYCCAKGGVRMLARTAGVELAEHGIGVVNLAPGAVATAMNRQTLEDPQTSQALQQAIPMGRVAQSDEIADLAAYLASDQARYITATTVCIDGGMMQQSPGL